MARHVNDKRGIEIHQALHGYADGHRRLAISTKLGPTDSKVLLTFSDISGPGAKPGPDGYITGFPLSGAGVFALSRTWLASDMPRPGCVWTHTLLVRFADLAIIECLEELNDCFRYPEHRRGFEKYNAPLNYVCSDWSYRPIDITEVGSLIFQELYGKPNGPVFIEKSDAFSDDVVLALWSQQWPRLRRSFSFCSLCTRDRSSSGIDFDLQMFPSSFSSVARPVSPTKEANVGGSIQDGWLLKAIQDLEHPNEQGLRSFLKLIGSDVEGGREAFKPLCSLFAALQEEYGGTTTLGRALVTLESEPILNNARTARTAVANVVTKNIEHVDDLKLSFLWKNIEFVDKELLSKHGTSVVRALWRSMPEAMDKLEVHNTTQRYLFDRAVETIELSELLRHIVNNPVLEEIALNQRPEVTQEVAFWRNVTDLEKAVEIAAVSNNRKKSIEAMIEAERRELPKLAVWNFGERDILSAVAVPIRKKVEGVDLRPWVVAATRDPTGIAEILREEDELDLAFLTMVAGCVSEEAVPNPDGEDPWLIALSHAGALDDGNALDLRLAVLVLGRALGVVSRSPGGLVRAGFESVDRAVAEGRLPEDLWQKLERHLPYSIFWFNWSKTYRLRSAVADLFVDRRLPPEEFVRLTRDFDVFGELVRQMSWSRSGRNYLKEVMRVLKSEERSSKGKGKGSKKSKIIRAIMNETE